MAEFAQIVSEIQQYGLSETMCAEIENLQMPMKEWAFFYSQILPRLDTSPEAIKIRLLCEVQASANPNLELFQTATHQYSEEMRILLARGFCVRGQFAQALNLLEDIQIPSKPRYQFWYWFARATALVHFNNPDCFEAFYQAKTYCSGHEFGVVHLNEGVAYEQLGEIQAALQSWREALKFLNLPSYALALCHDNLGQALLSLLLPESAEQFSRSMAVARHPQAAQIKSRAMCSLGDYKRLFGQHQEAQKLYQRAFELAQKREIIIDQINAKGKLGFLALLSNRFEAAQKFLQEAVALTSKTQSHPWIFTIVALLEIKQGKLKETALSLAHMPSLGNIASERKKVLCAELERQQGNLKAARDHILQLDCANVGARELVGVLPELFAWAKAEGLPVPLAITPQRHIRIQAIGDKTGVFVNGKELKMTKAVFEVLVYFAYFTHLEKRETEEVIKTLYFEELSAGNYKLENARQSFHTLLGRLRLAILWDDVIVFDGQMCFLGKEATWEFDWTDSSQEQCKNFLKSYRRSWIKDITHPY